MLSIDDDGVGGAEASRGSGLTGLNDRVEALGGSIRVRSPTGEGGGISPSSCPPSRKPDVVEWSGCLPATPVAD
jgi:nitrate/nitrite-specific signal transduction histidine kinase